ncbi:MAG: YXWGXW repeat-containing protein [Candidatus Hydrogenedentes bacterium]|nr:YXWGXW repeat-containing protein [Candidatus Hydrogenedentota bacterium]
MKASRRIAVPALGIWVVPLLLLGVAAFAQGEATTEAGVQVLTRGPVHEAFAEASLTGTSASVVITKAPPDPIVELPPDQRPEGANVAWIPGYWSWDDDRSDFIWASGVWRDIPPGRQWVPGYWASAGNGSQWISGFWGDAARTEVDYLPSPPKALEAGPSSPTPGPGHIWTPGCWVWQQTRYDWQPGNWVAQQPDWVWTPAHYTWTPRGYVYVPGYWDYDITHRGVMFAPVYYEQPVYARSGYYYSPNTIIDLAAIAASLFVQPRSNRYYYGDYYDARYEGRGYYPWHSKLAMQYGDDPIYMHYRSTQMRRDPDWDVHTNDLFRYRREHVDARPPQTLALQINFINNQPAGAPANVIIGRSLADAVLSKTQPLRFTPVNMDERKQLQTRGREVIGLQFQRAIAEKLPAASGKTKETPETARPVKLQLPASPVAARLTERTQGAKTPPPAPVAPKPQVAGKERQVKPQKVEAKTDTSASQKKQGKTAPQANIALRDNSKSPDAKSSKPPQVQGRPKAVEPKREPTKTGPPNQAVKSQKPDSKTQAPQSDNSKKKQGKQGQAPDKEDNKGGKANGK